MNYTPTQALHGASLTVPGLALCAERPAQSAATERRPENPIGLLGRWFGHICELPLTALRRANARRSAVRELHKLDDRLLRDIGVRRDDIESVVSALDEMSPAASPSAQPNAPPTPIRLSGLAGD